MSISFKLFDHIVTTAYINGRLGALKNHANNHFVAINNVVKGAALSYSALYAQWSLIEAGLIIKEAAPLVSGALGYAGNMSWIWLTPLALALIVSARGLGEIAGDPEVYAWCGWFEDYVIRSIPGSSLLIQSMLFATSPMIQAAIMVSALAVAYFTGGYLAMALAAYTAFDTFCKIQLLSQPLQHLNARITQGLFGATFIFDNIMFQQSILFGLRLMRDALFDINITPLMGFDNFASFAKVDLTKTYDLIPHPQATLIRDINQVAIEKSHIRPATLPKDLGGIKLDEIDFKGQVDKLWEEMEAQLEENIVKREIANEKFIYDKWRGRKEDSFNLQKEFLKEGHRLCINTLAGQRRNGDSRQEDLAKAAAAAVMCKTGQEGHIAQHSFLVTLGITGHFCPTRKGEGVDSLVSAYLSESANDLSTQVEGVLRDERSRLFQEHFIGKLLEEHEAEFGSGKGCDLRNVHYKYALVYVAGLDLGLHEHWGAHNEVSEFGSDTIRAVSAAYERTECGAAAREAFEAAYSRDFILETIQNNIASGNNGTLKLAEVEAWFVDWLIEKKVVKLETDNFNEIKRIEKAINDGIPRLGKVKVDATDDPNDTKAQALADLIQPDRGKSDRTFVDALALERYRNEDSADFKRAYLKTKAKNLFRDVGCDYVDSEYTKLAPKKTWIATMLAEMGFLKNAD